MDTNANGIDEEGLNKLALELFDYVEKLNRILNSIDTIISDSALYYTSVSANILRRRFNNTKVNFPIVKENIMGYKDDLIRVKRNFSNISTDIAAMILRDSNQIADIAETDNGNSTTIDY